MSERGEDLFAAVKAEAGAERAMVETWLAPEKLMQLGHS
jgi:hypothetical protein